MFFNLSAETTKKLLLLFSERLVRTILLYHFVPHDERDDERDDQDDEEGDDDGDDERDNEVDGGGDESECRCQLR